jgi:hypothetical protein
MSKGGNMIYHYRKSIKNYILLFAIYYLLFAQTGCASVKEGLKGFLGLSTKVLEDTRTEAIKRQFSYDIDSCYNKVKASLKERGSYIYKDDPKKHMLAIYVSDEDTTPVGLFFTEVDKNITLLEISSPSTSAKELIAKRIFLTLEEQK